MRVRVRYFASVREALGLSEEDVDLPSGSSVASLQELLTARHAVLARHLNGLRLAVGSRFATRETPLTEGVEVALLPPVSGG